MRGDAWRCRETHGYAWSICARGAPGEAAQDVEHARHVLRLEPDELVAVEEHAWLGLGLGLGLGMGLGLGLGLGFGLGFGLGLRNSAIMACG